MAGARASFPTDGRRLAELALQRVMDLEGRFERHDGLCTERWQASRQLMESLRDDVARNSVEAQEGRRKIHDKVDTIKTSVTAEMHTLSMNVQKGLADVAQVSSKKNAILVNTILAILIPSLLGLVGWLATKAFP